MSEFLLDSKLCHFVILKSDCTFDFLREFLDVSIYVFTFTIGDRPVGYVWPSGWWFISPYCQVSVLKSFV